MNLIASWFLHALSLILIPFIISGIKVDSITHALIAAAVIGIINTLIKPILVILTLPITLLTLGLFIFVINGVLFWLAGSYVPGFHVTNLTTGIVGALAYSVISTILVWIFIDKKSD